MTPDDLKVRIYSLDNELGEKLDQLDTLEKEQVCAIEYFYALYHELIIREKSVSFLFKWVRGLEDSNCCLKLKLDELLSKLSKQELELYYLTKRLEKLRL